ncbi:MAG: hypothetical protein JSS64_00715 [Bacteroidetes bacterium]|nr:hypothetical protein [Bacteroidota bacterium]
MTQKLNTVNGLQGRTDRTPAGNTVLPKWRQKCYYETFVLNSTAVILLNFGANNPPLRQYPNDGQKWQPARSFCFASLCYGLPRKPVRHECRT